MNARAERIERRLAAPLLVAALLTIPAIAIEQSDAGAPWGTLAAILNWTVWSAFLTEAIVMLRVVDDPWRWDRPLSPAALAYRLICPSISARS